MKKLFKILLTIICLIIPAQVIAAPVPIVIPVRTPSVSESTLREEKELKYNYGVYKLGQQPLILGISQEDYPKLEELFKGTMVWNEDSIFRDILDKAKRAGNIVVYDKKNKKGYEISEETLKTFLTENNLNYNEKNQIDVVEIWETDKTQVITFKEINIANKKLENIKMPISISEYKYVQIQTKFKELKQLRNKSLKKSENQIYFGENPENITNEELNTILKDIGTQQASTFMDNMEEIKSKYKLLNTILFSSTCLKWMGIVALILLFAVMLLIFAAMLFIIGAV